MVGVLSALLLLNTYWGFGGTGGLAWVVGGNCVVPLALIWIQQAALVIGIASILARAGIWRAPAPWIWKVATWTMAAAFAGVGLQSLVGDSTARTRWLFAPIALLLCGLCVVVARQPSRTP